MGDTMGEANMEESIFIPVNPIQSSLQNQIIASIICTLGTLSFGCSLAWLSPVLDDLQKTENGPLDTPMTEAELSWAGGLLCLGALAGQPIFNIVAKKKGRKPSAYTAGLPLLISCVMKIYARSGTWILVSQFLCGMGGAGCVSLPPLYVSEISEVRARGTLSSVIMVQYGMGVFLCYLLGALVSYETLNLVLLAGPLLFLLAFWFMPETPLFRLQKGEEEAAARAVAWLRKLPLNGVAVRTELLSLARQLRGAEPLDITYQPTKEDLAREMEWLRARQPQYPESVHKRPIEIDHPFQRKRSSWRILISSRAAVRGLIICLALISAQNLMGLSAISTYASVVFEAVHLKLSADLCAIIYSIILVVGCGLGTVLMDYVGRRFLQISCCFTVFVGEVILAAFFYMSSNDYAPDWMSWIALIALTLSVIAFNAGSGPVVFVVLAEYFSSEVRDLANNITMVYMWITGFLLLQFFSPAVSAFGVANVFFFFAAASLVSGILSYMFLPETKGKTQDEVIQILETGVYYK